MKRLLILILALSGYAHATAYAITAARINGTTAATPSACNTASACNGWVLELDTSSSVATGGTYALGLSQATNNFPSAAKVVLTVTSTGYVDCSGSTTSVTRTIYATHQLRQPYNTASTNDETNAAGTMTFRLALSDFIYTGETVTVQVVSSFYTDGGGNTLQALAAGTAVTNNSTLAYSAARTIANWSWPGFQRISGSSFTVRAVAFQRHAMNGLPVACVAFTAADAHSHSVTVNVTRPTIDPQMLLTYDHAAVIEYIANISTSTFTQGDRITVNFIAYPWVGDSTSTMNTADAAYAQPTPLYAPQYYAFDGANTYSSAAYVDGSVTFPGAHTSGTCAAGELMTQSTSNAKAYLIDAAGCNGAGPISLGQIVSGTVNSTNGSTWTGGTSGAVFTQSGGPTYAGVDSAACAVAESAWNPASPPSACRTINGAAVKMAAFNNATSTPTHNDACGTIYLAKGYYNWTGASASVSNTTANCWATITPTSGLAKTDVVIDQQTGSKSFGSACTSAWVSTSTCGTPPRLKNLTVNITTGPVSIFDSITFLWFDNVHLEANGTAPVYGVTDSYITGGSVPSTLAGNGLEAFSTTNTSWPLIRGVDLTGMVASANLYTVLANTNTAIGSNGPAFRSYVSSQGNPKSVAPIFAFNTLYRDYVNGSTALVVYVIAGSYTPLGAAVIQNIFESNTATANQLLVQLSADGAQVYPSNNTMFWNNIIVGGRINHCYDDASSTFTLRTAWSEIGNISDVAAIKSDTFPTANAARVGNWSCEYQTGSRSNVDVEATGFAATGTFKPEFGGLWSSNPTITCGATQPCTSTTNAYSFPAYKSRQAYDGSVAGTGSGDYRLLSNSPGINLVPSGGAVLPYDLAGQIRNNSGHGSAGAYEQAIGMTQVLGW